MGLLDQSNFATPAFLFSDENFGRPKNAFIPLEGGNPFTLRPRLAFLGRTLCSFSKARHTDAAEEMGISKKRYRLFLFNGLRFFCGERIGGFGSCGRRDTPLIRTFCQQCHRHFAHDITRCANLVQTQRALLPNGFTRSVL